MPEIRVLDQSTINQIAAGEVVERPSSIVKELVENAVDANSTAVTVEIKGGGIDFIRITDNGCGIEKEQVRKAFLPHATSKIRSASDLETVVSLGFRGEALSSIASVAKVELVTKTDEGISGIRYVIEGGEEKSYDEIGCPEGTTFIIRDLFFNTPARRKFLKSKMTEAGYVESFIQRLALSHPAISFKFICDNKNKISTSGNGNLKDVIYNIFGRDVAMNLLPVKGNENGILVDGYIGKPVISRGNRNYENYFVNGRYVKSKIIAKGIEDGYKSFMMQHRYPFVCLEFQIDGNLLDVNVHPTKMELRFSNQNLVYDLLERMTKDALSGRELIPEVTLDEPKKQVVMPEKAPQQMPPVQTLREPESTYQVQKPVAVPTASVERTIPSYQKPEQKVPLEKMWTTPEPQKEPVKPQDKNLEYFMEQMRKRVEKRYKAPEAPAPAEQRETTETAQSTVPEQSATAPETSVEEKPPQKPEQLDLFDGKLLSKEAAVHHVIIGQLFDTYWLVQFGEKLYIIDQHAAHEKVLYERLMKDLRNRTFQSQMLSPPIILNLSMQEEELFLKYRSCFTEMGFEIEEFGEKAYAVRAVPANLPGVARREILMELLDSLSDITGSGNSESLMDKVASMSCKAAVKGNHQMSAMEAKALIDELLSLENPYNCPHGRPTIISMSKYELEKKFKRIV